MIELLKKLCTVPAPAGSESPLHRVIKEYLAEKELQYTTDPLGNLIVRKKQKRPDTKTLLLDAHADSIFMTITGHCENGFLRFAQNGFDTRTLPGQEVEILSLPPIKGLISATAPHLASNMEKALPVSELFIDTGSDRNFLQESVPVGTKAILAPTFKALSEDIITGTSLDDRAGCAAIIEAFLSVYDTDLPYDLILCFSAQEELHRRGAQTAASNIQPDLAIVVDVTHGVTYDNSKNAFPLGSGVSIGCGPTLDKKATKELLACAKKKEIKHTREIMGGDTGTNAHVIAVAGSGTPCALLSLPLRYMHTPVETASRSDLNALVALLTAYLKEVQL